MVKQIIRLTSLSYYLFTSRNLSQLTIDAVASAPIAAVGVSATAAVAAVGVAAAAVVAAAEEADPKA